jgi:phage tail sheath protein FI
MPVQTTYPGVYIEEISSGVRTITGVATSIAAFIGRARSGPTDDPVVINSFGDFERIFGGLWIGSPLGYAVRDFYLNGGSQAIIVRLFHPFPTETDRDKAVTDATAAAKAVSDAATKEADKAEATKDTVATAARATVDTFKTKTEFEKVAADLVAKAAEDKAKEGPATPASVAEAARDAESSATAAAVPGTKARISGTNLSLEAASEGAWGNSLRARVDHKTREPSSEEAPNSLFNLFVRDGLTGQIEVFRNLSITSGHSRQVDKILESESTLVQWSGRPPADLPNQSVDPADLTKIWDDNIPPTNAKVTSPASDGGLLDLGDFKVDQPSKKEGLFSLDKADLFNLLCIPPFLPTGDVDPNIVAPAAAYCETRRAMLLVDPRSDWKNKDDAKGDSPTTGVAGIGTNSKNAALFFPRLLEADPLRENRLEEFAPSGAVAGVFARTDTQRGVWKAPAGLEATLVGVPRLTVNLTDLENGELNQLGVNCLRTLPAAGRVVWGARTLQGNDRLASEWKYIPVRRTALFIEESLYRGTQWVVFEPNDEPLWAQIRMNVGAFMQNLFRQGAFQGKNPREAYLVKCDKETTTQNHVNQGIVNIVVGFAPLKPAEFVIIKIQQLAGQIET